MWIIYDKKDTEFRNWSRDMGTAKELITLLIYAKRYKRIFDIKEIEIVFESGEYCKRVYNNLWVLFNKDGKQLMLDSLDNIEMSLVDCARRKIFYEEDFYAVWKEEERIDNAEVC